MFPLLKQELPLSLRIQWHIFWRVIEMNQPTEKLAKQARAWAETAYKNQNEKFTSHWDNPVGYTVTQFFEQKFAELIVRECAELIDNQATITAAQTYDDVFVAVYNANEANANKIRKHFGVKE
jgi:hypothetical protein